ncbi:septal ring lytic transglycosylase RlpA family protein [Carboxylicivirga linearis]|uniref:Probable endolytic peptidoglycan transglycosylase RlpA n=1 Tax=Carboxylicivirga linearis TaxID=1628157 RepID=A0ABS5JV26_9BACT|nr:septal ring lytic transglycosylase RlpA family protein [Carboxylicivirga linearis]MBS2098186.1 septal ring lytic transglycosylase RlpA family protein [Carboxylicivirga linearis]
MKSLLIAAFVVELLAQTFKAEGYASYYSSVFDGKTTASGEIFSNDSLTAAHPNLPFDTSVKITNLDNGKVVIVRINDRGPFVKNRVIDLTQEAAKHLDFINEGLCRVKIEIVLNN